MSSEAIIELNDATVPSRRDPEAASVEHVTWTVLKGEFWIVGGMQGAGKSDLIFMLGALTKPLAGTYRLFGQDMRQHFGDEFLPNRLRVGVVFDDARLFGPRTIEENIALPVRYHQNLTIEESASWVRRLLDATDVAEFADDLPNDISQPWRRRVALARALALQPEVLLLENPLRGLDRRHAQWWIAFIQGLSRGHQLLGGKPLTIIASTDEFRPWRDVPGQFARLERRSFAVIGAQPPEDEAHQTTLTDNEPV